jgi:hypothetical protein
MPRHKRPLADKEAGSTEKFYIKKAYLKSYSRPQEWTIKVGGEIRLRKWFTFGIEDGQASVPTSHN